MYFCALILAFASFLIPSEGHCDDVTCNVPTLIYEDIRCTPKFASPDDCCPQEYDCSHLKTRPERTCHLKGKYYQPGKSPDDEDVAKECKRGGLCKCEKDQTFSCETPFDGCAEEWVDDYPKPFCNLRYELNRCCAEGEICPPFDNNVKCEVNGKTYDEGQLFPHPKRKCTDCACAKGFDGTLDAPTCQRQNCTAELYSSAEIDASCAPVYRSVDDCCPHSWICPDTSGTYESAPSSGDSVSKCVFGEKTLDVGGKYKAPGDKVSCTCDIPPFLTCIGSTK